MSIRINYNLQCEVDKRKCDCKKEPAHCHITRNGRRIAQVLLNPVMIKSGHSLDHNEINLVYDVVSKNRDELERQYNYNRDYGADY